MLFRAVRSVIGLMAVSCTQGSPTLDSNNDLHCAVVVHTVEMNMAPDVPPQQQRGIYALRTWYYRDVTEAQLKEAGSIVEELKRNSEAAASIGQECATRAFKHKEFSSWSAAALREFKPRR